MSQKDTHPPHPLCPWPDFQWSERVYQSLNEAIQLGGFTGIGLHQTGPHERRFIHLDIAKMSPRPWVWSD